MVVDAERGGDRSEKLREIIESAHGTRTATELIGDLEELLIDDADRNGDARPPRLYVFGPSGAGKSSLVNALTSRDVADVGTVEPTTGQSAVYPLSIPDRNAEWELVDSRGLFESVPADGDVPVETVAELEADLARHDPDLLLHVVTPERVRAGEDEFAAVQRLDASVDGGLPPRLVCLNKVDTHLTPGGDWPPERNPTLARHTVATLELLADVLSVPRLRPVLDGAPLRGLLFDSSAVLGVVPLYVKEAPYWNLSTLLDVLGEYAPTLVQHQRRERRMRRLAREQTDVIATAVSRVPRAAVAGPNHPIVSSYQRSLVGLVGSFAGAELSAETVDEYFDAMASLEGTDSVLARTLDRVADLVGSLLGTGMANLRARTYGIGRSAEAYFFDDELVAPGEFRDTSRRRRIITEITNR